MEIGIHKIVHSRFVHSYCKAVLTYTTSSAARRRAAQQEAKLAQLFLVLHTNIINKLRL